MYLYLATEVDVEYTVILDVTPYIHLCLLHLPQAAAHLPCISGRIPTTFPRYRINICEIKDGYFFFLWPPLVRFVMVRWRTLWLVWPWCMWQPAVVLLRLWWPPYLHRGGTHSVS